MELHVDLSMCGGGGTVGGVGGGGNSSGGAPRKRRLQREEESQITSLLQRLILPHAVNYKRLVVWPGRYVWRLAIDIVVLRCDGCILDAASIALREALVNTKLPRVQAVMEGKENNDTSGGNNSSSKNDLMVDGDWACAKPPVGAEECPLVVTVSVLSAPPSATEAIVGGGPSTTTASTTKRYRSISIIDARTEEEACASSRVCVSVDPAGMVCGVHTLGGGGVVVLDNETNNNNGGGEESNGAVHGSSMPLAMLGDIVTSAAMAAKNLYELVDNNGDNNKEGEEVQVGVNGLRRKSVVSTEGSDGYGYLLKNHFHIQ